MENEKLDPISSEKVAVCFSQEMFWFIERSTQMVALFSF